tara:strand:+ start:306 stop:650 length:345 start_codon:yes stop_codon:yes gene_type:complete
MDKHELLKKMLKDMGVGVEETVIDKGDKVLLMAMTYEFVIIIIKLSSRLKHLDELDDDTMDDIQESVCKLQSLVGKIINVSREDIYEGLKMATGNNGDDFDADIANMMANFAVS